MSAGWPLRICSLAFLGIIMDLNILFKKKSFLRMWLLSLDGEEEREREGEKHGSVVSPSWPDGGLNPQPKHVP